MRESHTCRSKIVTSCIQTNFSHRRTPFVSDIFSQVKVCFGSKFTSATEDRRFNWLIYDSVTSQCARGRFSKSRGLSARVSFLTPPPPSTFNRSIYRLVLLCSRNAQKRLLRRLFVIFQYGRLQRAESKELIHFRE